MLSGPCGGCRAVDLAAQASLSRPAVSRHLNVLRQAGLVRTRREGARVYHYLAPDPALLRQLTGLVLDVQRIAAGAPDRSAPQDPAAPPPPRADAVQ